MKFKPEKRQLFVSVAALTLGLSATADTLTLPAGTYADSDTFGKATKVVVAGSTTLDFGTTKPGFKGEIEIQSGGRLGVASSPNNFGTPTKITVANGGTLDLSWKGNEAGSLASTPLFIAGTGTDGKGAVWRGVGGGINSLFGVITLTDDAKIGSNSIQCGSNGNAINLEGHTLTWDGGTVNSGTLYLPSVPFKNGGSTDNPGHLAVTSGRIFFRNMALDGGSSANTITVAAGARIKLREMTVRPKWKLIMGANAFLETDNADTSIGAADKNVWAGPIETTGTLVISADKNPSYVSASGGILGNHDIKGAGEGLVTVRGSNEVCKVIHTDTTGTLRFADSTNVISGPIMYNMGKVEFTNSVVRLTYETTGGFNLCDVNPTNGVAALEFRDTKVIARIKDYGAAFCRLYPGRDANSYGTVSLDGANVTNMAASVGFNGIGGFYQHGGEFYWPLDSVNYDTPGNSATGYGYYRLDRKGRFTVDLATGTGALGGNGVCVLDIRDDAQVNCIGTNNNLIVCSGGGKSAIYGACGGMFTTEGSVNLSTPESFAKAQSVDFTFTDTGTACRVAASVQVRSTNGLSRVSLNVNDGAAFESVGAMRTVDAFLHGTEFYVNSNGGVFRPRRGAGDIFGGDGKATVQTNAPTAVTVFEKGITIDTSVQKDKTYKNPESGGTSASLVAPPTGGRRLASIALPEDAAFAKDVYLGSPLVTIASTGGGKAATAFALYDENAKKVTNIVVTCAGWGYDAATTTVTIDSGDRKNAYACAFTLEDQPVTGLGLRKTGAARFDIRRACTYRGDTEVEEGVLGFECGADGVAQGGMPVGSGIILHDGSTITMPAVNTAVTVPFIRGCGTTSYGFYTITESLEVNAEDAIAGKRLKVNRTLSIGEDAVVRVRNPTALDACEDPRRFEIVEAGTLNVVNTPALEFADDTAAGGARSAWALRVCGNKLYLCRKSGFTISVR